MQNARIAIVGAGLAGLYAAYSLEKKGIKDHVILEAREILGGRIGLRCRLRSRALLVLARVPDRYGATGR